MYKNSSGYTYSASDLIVFMNSPFASWMNRLAIDDPERLVGIEKDHDEMMGLLAEKGNEHEALFLNYLKQEYGSENVAVIENDKNTAANSTKEAMKTGYKVIFQAYLERDNFAGFADFLVRREGDSDLGDYYYEAWDTKLSKTTRPYFIIQLCCYSWMLESIQGKLPEEVVVVLGNKKQERFRIAAHYSYFMNLKARFLQGQSNFSGDEASMPDPSLETEFGPWSTYAKQLLNERDSLAQVATIRKKHIKLLQESEITTLKQLAETKLTQVKGISSETFEKIQAQAEIQHISKGLSKPLFKVLKNDSGKGLSALPKPSSMDMFFDIEGHPLVEGGLEYLWGVSYHDKSAAQGKSYAFKDFWAHDQEQEKKAFEDFIDWTYARWQKDKTMHVYHYASYEITAIRKLSTRNQTRLAEVAELLRQGVFIDLYKIVKSGLLIGEPKYSIKNVEHLYRGQRTTDVANGGESVVFYESWREEGGTQQWAIQENGYIKWLANPDNFDWTEWQTLKDIRDYNIDDCESTLELYEWLLEQQKLSGITYSLPADIQPEKEKTDRQIKSQEQREGLLARQQALIDRLEASQQLKSDPIAQLLVSLLQFYERERKPQTWAYFDRLEKNDDELFDDDTVVFDINLEETSYDEGKIIVTGLYNKDQSIRTDKFGSATIRGSEVKVNKINFTELDVHKGLVSFEISANDEVAYSRPNCQPC